MTWNPHIAVNQFLCCISLEPGFLDLWDNILKIMDCSQLHFAALCRISTPKSDAVPCICYSNRDLNHRPVGSHSQDGESNNESSRKCVCPKTDYRQSQGKTDGDRAKGLQGLVLEQIRISTLETTSEVKVILRRMDC